MNKILPLVVNISEKKFLLALDKSMEVINPENQEKVLFESLALDAFHEYIRQNSFDIKLGFNLPDSYDSNEVTAARRELFPINLTDCNGFFINVLNINSLFQKDIPIEINIFESPSSADFYIPVYVDIDTRQVYFLGYFTKEQVNSFAVLFSENLYKLSTKYLKPLEDFKNELIDSVKNTINLETLNFEELKNVVYNHYEKLSLFEIPEDYIPDPEYLPGSIYNSLFKSELCSSLYLHSQLIFKKIMSYDSLEKLSLLTINFFLLYQKNNKTINSFIDSLKDVYSSFEIPDKALIIDTYEQIQQSHQALIDINPNDYTFSNGKTHWFAGQIKQVINQIKPDKVPDFLDLISTSLTDITNSYLKTDKKKENSNISHDFDRDKFEIIGNFIDSLETNAMLGLLKFNDLKLNLNFEIPQIQLIIDYFDSELNSQNSKEINTLLTIIMFVSKEKGLLKKLTLETPQQMVAIADLSLTISKLVYKISLGELKVEEAINYYFGRYQAIFVSIIKNLVNDSELDIKESILTVFGPVGLSIGIILKNILDEILIQYSQVFITKKSLNHVFQELLSTVKNSELINSLIDEPDTNIEDIKNTELLEGPTNV